MQRANNQVRNLKCGMKTADGTGTRARHIQPKYMPPPPPPLPFSTTSSDMAMVTKWLTKCDTRTNDITTELQRYSTPIPHVYYHEYSLNECDMISKPPLHGVHNTHQTLLSSQRTLHNHFCAHSSVSVI